MKKNISYNALVLIEEHLGESLKQLDRDLFRARKYDHDEEVRRLEWDKKQLEDAIKEVGEYSTYVCNYVSQA